MFSTSKFFVTSVLLQGLIFCICGKFNEIDCKVKVRFWCFDFSQQINEINPSSEAWKITGHVFFLFWSYHFNTNGFFLFTCTIIITLATNVHDVLVWFFCQKLRLYGSINLKVSRFRMQKYISSWIFFLCFFFVFFQTLMIRSIAKEGRGSHLYSSLLLPLS